jgi:host factor-I protein
MAEGKSKKAVGAFARSAQERFLTQMIEEHRRVAVFLNNGNKIEGEIVSFDAYAIFMKGAATEQVYKHAVSTIEPASGSRPRQAVDARGDKPRQPVIVTRAKRRITKVSGDGTDS